MIKKLLFTLLGCGMLALGICSLASANGGSLQGDPFDIVDTMVREAQGGFDIQKNKLNGAGGAAADHQGQIPKSYKFARTLDRLRRNIQPYLQWLVFLGLTLAVILLIWNGYRLVTHSAMGDWDPKTIKENIKNIVIGVMIMSGFVAILKLIAALLNMFFDV